MDLKTFAAFFLMAVCFIKLSDAQITGWAETGGNTATISGASGTMTVAAISDSLSAGGTLFTAVATPTSGAVTYAFSPTGNPGTFADATITTGVVTKTAAILATESATYTFVIVATEGANTGTATVTLSITDLPGLSSYQIPICLADAAASGTAVTTLTPTNTITLWAIADANFVVSSAGAVTTAVAMSASTTAGYCTTVTATDGTGLTSIANLYVVVGICSGALKITITAALVLMSFATAYLI